MNKQKLIEALDATSKSIEEIKQSLIEDDVCVREEIVPIIGNGHLAEQKYTELLANRLAWSYSTLHPEYKIDNQIKNLNDMISSQKISFVLNWIKRKGTDGLEEFFRLDLENQRKELQIALYNYEPEIREVFKKKFSQT